MSNLVSRKLTEVTEVFYRGFYRYFGVCDKKGNIKRNEHEAIIVIVCEGDASSLHLERD